ncbi:MAG: putative toxin-antitoxin system toxin component, PIN family [Bacteroidales bacterium]|nr:putative toxin-antitoxin system toxin component, PIN family [Bacteroidales bacterium]
MARLVLDTNSLIQCIARRSPYHDLWLSFLDGRNTLCVTTAILNEYAEILERKASPKFASLALDVIVNNPYTHFATPFYNFHVIVADPDDDKFVDCAVVSNAKFIVTEDSHFDVLKSIGFPPVEIIGLDDIMEMI